MPDVGGAYVLIQPDLEGFKARLDAELRSAMAGASAEATVRVDTGDAKAKLDEVNAELTAWDARHGSASADVETDRAQASLDELNAKLEAFGAKRETATANVDTNQAEQGMSSLLAGALALSPALVAVGAAAAGAFAALPAILGGLGVGVGALVIGLHGVLPALQAMQSADETAGQTANQNAQTALANSQARIASARQVQGAEEALANARVNAAQTVAAAEDALHSAEEGYTQSVWNEEQAQQAVITARQTAQRQLESYQQQLADGALAQRQAQLAVASAKQSLDATLSNPTASALQRQQAQLTYDQAVQHQRDQSTAYQQLQQDAAAANAKGVEGAQNVVQAEHNAAAATQSRVDAANHVAEAETALGRAQVQAAQAVSDAERNLNDALENQNATNERIALSSEKAAMGNTALAKAMANLGPAGQAFVTWIHDVFLPAVEGSGSSGIQNTLLPAIQKALQEMLPVIAAIEPYLVGAAAGIGQFLQQFALMLSSGPGLADLNAILSTGAGFMQTLGGATVTFFEAFGNLGAAAAPIVHDIAGALAGGADAFLRWTTDGGMTRFLAYVEQVGPQVFHLLGQVVGLLVDLGKSLAPYGPSLLSILSGITGFLDMLVRDVPGVGILVTLVGVFAELQKFAIGRALISFFADAAGGLIAMTMAATGLDAVPVVALFVGIAAAIAGLVYGIYQLWNHWTTIWGAIETAAVTVWDFLKDHWRELALIFGPAGFMAVAIDFLVTHWSEVWGAIQAVGEAIWGGIRTAAVSIWGGIVTAVTAVWDGLTTAASAVWNTVRSVFEGAVNGIIDVLNFFIRGINDVLGLIPGVNLHIGLIPHWTETPAPGSVGAIGGRLHLAAGGPVGTGTDTVPAMLTPGEYVVRREAVQAIGVPTLERLNAAHLGLGGIVGDVIGTVTGAVRDVVGAGAGAALDALMAPLRGMLAVIPVPLLQQMGEGSMNAIHDGIENMIKGGSHQVGGLVGYDQGGWLQPGFTTAVNTSGSPEPVLSAGQWDRLLSGTRSNTGGVNVAHLEVHGQDRPVATAQETVRELRKMAHLSGGR